MYRFSITSRMYFRTRYYVRKYSVLESHVFEKTTGRRSVQLSTSTPLSKHDILMVSFSLFPVDTVFSPESSPSLIHFSVLIASKVFWENKHECIQKFCMAHQPNQN